MHFKKFLKLFSSAVLFVFLLINFELVSGEVNRQLTDIGGHKNKEAIEYLSHKGIISGYANGTFAPDKVLNRAELLKILIANLEIPLNSQEDKNCFSDVTDQWFAPYICYAKKQGWVKGYSDGTFKPEQNVTKVEAIKVLVETQGVANDAFDDSQLAPYEDVSASVWYAKYIRIAKKMALLEETGTFFFLDTEMTRGSFAESYYRLLMVTKNNLTLFPGINYEKTFDERFKESADVIFEVDRSKSWTIPIGGNNFSILHFTITSNIEGYFMDPQFNIIVRQVSKEGGLINESVGVNFSDIKIRSYKDHSAYSASTTLDIKGNDRSQIISPGLGYHLEPGDILDLELSLDIAQNPMLSGTKIWVTFDPKKAVVVFPAEDGSSAEGKRVTNLYPTKKIVGTTITIVDEEPFIDIEHPKMILQQLDTSQENTKLEIGSKNAKIFKFSVLSEVDAEIREVGLGLFIEEGENLTDPSQTPENIETFFHSNFSNFQFFDEETGKNVLTLTTTYVDTYIYPDRLFSYLRVLFEGDFLLEGGKETSFLFTFDIADNKDLTSVKLKPLFNGRLFSVQTGQEIRDKDPLSLSIDVIQFVSPSEQTTSPDESGTKVKRQ